MSFFKQNILFRKKRFINQYSFLLDGVNERFNIDSVRTALATTTTGTWSCWVKPVDATPASSDLFISFGAGTDTGSLWFYIDPSGFLAAAGRTTLNQWLVDTDAAALSDNVWAHVAVVQDGTSPVLYVNGVAPAQAFLISTNKTIWFNNLVMNNGRIGCRFFTVAEGDGGLPFNGNIDEVGFFNTNLSAAGITEIYNNGKPKNLLKHSASNNLISYFRMGDKD